MYEEECILKKILVERGDCKAKQSKEDRMRIEVYKLALCGEKYNVDLV